MKRPNWTFAVRCTALLAVSLFCGVLAGQTVTLDRAPQGAEQVAGCGCGSGDCSSATGCSSGCCDSGFVGSCGQTIWGTQCISGCGPCGVEIGLFPPCPNPCDSFYLCDKLRDLKSGFDCGLKGMFGALLGSKGCNACGISGCNGSCVPLMNAAMAAMCRQCGCSDCGGCGGEIFFEDDCASGGSIAGCANGDCGQPTPTPVGTSAIPNVDATQPSPPKAPSAADPFEDDTAAHRRGGVRRPATARRPSAFDSVKNRFRGSHRTTQAARTGRTARTNSRFKHLQKQTGGLVQQARAVVPVPNSSKTELRPNLLRRATTGTMNGLLPAGRTTKSRLQEQQRVTGRQFTRHYRHARPNVAMRPATSQSNPPQLPAHAESNATIEPELADDDALLRFVE